MALSLGEIEAVLKARDELDIISQAREDAFQVRWSAERCDDEDASDLPLSLVVAGVVGALILSPRRVSRRHLFRPWVWASVAS